MIRAWICLAICVCLSADSAAQSLNPAMPRSARRLELVETWVTAVRSHVGGERDDAVAVARAMSQADLDDMWIALRAVLELIRDPRLDVFRISLPNRRTSTQVLYSRTDIERLGAIALAARARGGANDLLKRSAMLLADVRMLEPSDAEIDRHANPAAPRSYTLRLTDGQQTGLIDAAGHWELARTLLDVVAPTPSRDEGARLWYRGTLAFMLGWQQFDLEHFAHGVQLYPDDADVLFLAGCLHEALASPGMQAVIRSAVVPRGVTFDVESRERELRAAERLFGRALVARPQLVEARLRRGRVVGLLGRHADALTDLRMAESADEPLLVYYASLFLAAEAVALGRDDDAAAAYERAAAIYPRAQSPRIGRSQLAARAGERVAALNVMNGVLTLPDDERELSDPWWSYYVASSRDMATTLSQAADRMAPGTGR